MEPRSEIHSRRLAILDDTATFQQYGIGRKPKTKVDKGKKNTVGEFIIPTVNYIHQAKL